MHDLVGADHLLPGMQADVLIADKAFDADARVLEPLVAAGKGAVIPPKPNRKVPRKFDRHPCQAGQRRASDREFLCRTEAISSYRNAFR